MILDSKELSVTERKELRNDLEIDLSSATIPTFKYECLENLIRELKTSQQQQQPEMPVIILSLQSFAPITRVVKPQPPIHLTRADVDGGFVLSTEVEEK